MVLKEGWFLVRVVFIRCSTAFDPHYQEGQSGLTILTRQSVGTYRGNELTSNWSVKTHSQSFQLAERLGTDPNMKHGISAHKVIFTVKKKAQVGNDSSNLAPKFSHVRKKPPALPLCIMLYFNVFMC